MPADLALSTNTPTATFELHQIQSLGDRRHFAAFLIIRSGPFAAATPFVFTTNALREAASGIESMVGARAGAAQLAAREGSDVITFEASEAGALRIAGRLRDADNDQHLQFGFRAEWDGMSALAQGMRDAIASE